MKRLKRINELFDDESMKSKFDTQYLSGGKNVLKDFKKIPEESSHRDKIVRMALHHSPWLSQMEFAWNGKTVYFGFHSKKFYQKDYWEWYFIIEIATFGDNNFNLKCTRVVTQNSKELINDTINRQLIDVNGLSSVLNGEVKRKLIQFSRYLKTKIDEEIFDEDDMFDISKN